MNNEKLAWKYEDYYNDNGEVVGVLVHYYDNGVFSTEVLEKKGEKQLKDLSKIVTANAPVFVEQLIADRKSVAKNAALETTNTPIMVEKVVSNDNLEPVAVVADDSLVEAVVEERNATADDLRRHNRNNFVKGVALGAASVLIISLIGLKLYKDQNKAITPIVVTNGDKTNGNGVTPNAPVSPVAPVVETKDLVLDKELKANDIETTAPAVVQYLAQHGMQRTEQDVYSLLYLMNSENITQEEIKALVDKNLLDDTVVKIISDGLSIISDITSFNSHKIDELQAAGKTITMNDLISIKPFSISNSVDTANIEYNEAKQVEIMNTKDQEAASKLVLDHMHWITGAEMPDAKFNNEEGSLGAEFAIKQIISTTILQGTEEFVTGTFSESVQLEIDDSEDFIAFVRDTCGLEFQSKTK